MNKFYRVTGTAVAALTLAASAATFGAPYAAARPAAPHAAAASAAGVPAPHPNIPAADGFNSNTVEQAGIEADCHGSTESVFAWREVFPHPEQPFNMTIRPGDSITAKVSFRNGRFKMRVKDNTTGEHRTVRQQCASTTCRRSSAEVISEAPTVSGKQSSLADYGAQAFSGISIRNSNGQTGGIRSSHWNAFRIFQIGISTHNVIAAPTALHGPAFAVYWLGEN